MTAPTDALAAGLRADIAGLEARLGAHRQSLRRAVRTYRATLREPEDELRRAQARAAMHHEKEMLRIHSLKLAEARTRLAEHSAARSAA